MHNNLNWGVEGFGNLGIIIAIRLSEIIPHPSRQSFESVMHMINSKKVLVVDRRRSPRGKVFSVDPNTTLKEIL